MHHALATLVATLLLLGGAAPATAETSPTPGASAMPAATTTPTAIPTAIPTATSTPEPAAASMMVQALVPVPAGTAVTIDLLGADLQPARRCVETATQPTADPTLSAVSVTIPGSCATSAAYNLIRLHIAGFGDAAFEFHAGSTLDLGIIETPPDVLPPSAGNGGLQRDPSDPPIAGFGATCVAGIVLLFATAAICRRGRA